MPTKSSHSPLHRALLKKIPPALVKLAENRGEELYAVGGCVRDVLMKRELVDIDVAVVGDAPALARELAAQLHAGEVAIYARFGTALVKLPGMNLELATARRESYSAQSRKPSKVIPTSIDEDLRRRDFTINALAVGLTGPHTGKMLDLFQGIADMERRVIRTPLEPGITFSDDPLRMLRAVRFAADLHFEIERGTWNALRRNAERLKIVAAERIGDEFWRMLEGAGPVRAMQMLIRSGLMDIFLPEVTAMAGVEQVGKHHHKDVLKHTLQVMQNVVDASPDPLLRLAALLHDVGKPRTKRFEPGVGWTFHAHEVVGARMTWQIGRRLKLGRERLTGLTNLVRLHMRPVNLTSEGVTDSAIRRLMAQAGDALDDQLILCRADITTANPKLVDKYLKNFDEMSRRMGDVDARDRMRKFQSPVRGEEIIELCGVPAGPLVGALKERVEDAILDGIIPYEYEAAKQYLLKIKDEVIAEDLENLQQERRQRSRARRNITADDLTISRLDD